MELGGFYAAVNFLDWMKSKLNSGVYALERGNFGKGNQRQFGSMNLTEFHEATGVELSLVASDTTDSRILVLASFVCVQGWQQAQRPQPRCH